MKSFDDDVRRQIEIYGNIQHTSCDDNNPLLFWRGQQHTLPILSKIAKSFFVIQASLAKSE